MESQNRLIKEWTQAKDGAKGLCAGLETASKSAGEIATAATSAALGRNQQTVQVEQQQEVTVDNSDIYKQIADLAKQMTDENDKAAVENVLNQISATKTQTVDVQAEVEVENPYVTALKGIASGADALSKQLSAEWRNRWRGCYIIWNFKQHTRSNR